MTPYSVPLADAVVVLMASLEPSDDTAIDLRLTRPQRQALADRSRRSATRGDATMVEFLTTSADAARLLDER